jgi:nucleotide-binding universal stress UspA family protein
MTDVAATASLTHDEAPSRRILVAVDGSPGSRAALRRAATEATAHGASLEVVMAWSYLDQVIAPKAEPQYGEERAAEDLAAIVEEELGEQPAVGLDVHVVNDLPARAILGRAEGAWLVVVGSRGLGGFKGLLLGSVSQQIVHHAPCPVLVVPGPERSGAPPR